MKVVYEPENLIDAHLVKGVLEQTGIPVYLRGEHLAGGIGELPVCGLYALCVAEVFEPEARATLAILQRDRCSFEEAQAELPDPEWGAVQA